MDELLVALANISRQLLPFLGCLVLIFLFLLIRRLIKFFDELSVSLSKVNSTIDNVDKSLEQLRIPLNTAVTISHTIDTIHGYSVKAVNELLEFIVSNLILLKEWLNKILHKENADHNDVVIKDEEEPSDD
ncbi:MAG: hypothetical protein VB012_01215 [Erysipelotrichaceae bacterium]|nr:hypothetical protein [Erysipelotrichaceae bacterium]